MKIVLTPFRLALLTACLTGSLQAKLLVYESYDYPEGEPAVPQPVSQGGVLLPVSEGGAGIEAKKGPDSVSPIAVAGLTYTGGNGKALATRGQAAKLEAGGSDYYTPYATDSEPFDNLRRPDGQKGWGAPNTEIWFSYLFRVSGSPDGTSKIAIKWNLGSQTPIGLINNTGSNPLSLNLISKGTREQVEPDRVYLIVGRVKFGEADSEGNIAGSIAVWVDPPVGEPLGDLPPNAEVPLTNMRLTDFTYEMRSESPAEAVFDEVRVGETYEDVTPAAP